MPIRAKVHITLKEEVPDTPGSAIAERLRSLGFSEVKEVRAGKFLELIIESGDREKTVERADAMCQRLLSNPAVEEYEVLEVEEVK